MTEEEDLLGSIKRTRFLKESTKTEYLKRISDFQEEAHRDLNQLLLNPAETVPEILKLVDSKRQSMHTADKIACCFIAVFNYNQVFREKHKDEYDSWNKLTKKKIKDVLDAKYNANAPTQRQVGAYTSYESIIAERDGLRKGSFERLLLYMYTAIPPVRNDYHNLKIYFKKPRFNIGNYLIFRRETNSCIVLNEFKTDRSYDPITIKLPRELYIEINDSLSTQPRDHLFVSTQTGKPYHSS
jgi:hypothetical protein